jgi:hypothetical protein
MACALSDHLPLAITGMEVFQCIVLGGLAAPNDVYPDLSSLILGVSHSRSS